MQSLLFAGNTGYPEIPKSNNVQVQSIRREETIVSPQRLDVDHLETDDDIVQPLQRCKEQAVFMRKSELVL